MSFDTKIQRSVTDFVQKAQRDLPDATTAQQIIVVDEATGSKLAVNADGSINTAGGSGVPIVGVKNITGDQINPAEEDGNLLTIKNNTGNIPTKGQALEADSMPVVLPANQVTTLTPPPAITGFSTSANQTNGNQKTQVIDTSGNVITPTQDDTVILLRRLVKLLENIATVDINNRQRVVVEAAVISSGTVTAVTTVGNIGTIAGVDPRFQMIDWARQAYNSGIRNHLSFT